MPETPNPMLRASTPHLAPEIAPAEEFTWLIENFVSQVPGAEHAIVISSDGVALTASRGFHEEHADQLAAIASGMHSLAAGTAKLFGKGEPEDLILRMGYGHLVVMGISDGSSLAVLTAREAEMKVIAYQMTNLVESAGHALTPELRDELAESSTRAHSS